MSNLTKVLTTVAPLIVVAFLMGCRTPGFPKTSYNSAKQAAALQKKLEDLDAFSKYYSAGSTESEKIKLRDELIAGRVALIDINYLSFIADASFNRQATDFTGEVAEMGLGLATAAVGGATTKTILGAVSTGVAGTKLGIDKNFFYEKTIPVLFTSMNAQRKEALIPLLKGQHLSTTEYPLTQALADIEAYYFAGTFIGALQALQADAGAKNTAAQAKINSIRFNEDDAAKAIRRWIWPNGPSNENSENVTVLKEWLNLKSIVGPIENFLEESKYSQQRKDFFNQKVEKKN